MEPIDLPERLGRWSAGRGPLHLLLAARHRVAVLPGDGLDVSGAGAPYVRPHFLAPPERLTEAVRRLAAAWHTYEAAAHRPPARPAIVVRGERPGFPSRRGARRAVRPRRTAPPADR